VSTASGQRGFETVADEADHEDIYTTERHLFYVDFTRARDHLLMTSAAPIGMPPSASRCVLPRWPPSTCARTTLNPSWSLSHLKDKTPGPCARSDKCGTVDFPRTPRKVILN
jgi:hypothetical protein